MVPLTSSPRFPDIPPKIEAYILSFCDQATLAKCSTLSLAFLQLSSRLLYEDVVLYGVESLHELLCARPVNLLSLIFSFLPKSQSELKLELIDLLPFSRPPFQDPSYQCHLYPYLALTQIKKLSLVIKEGDPYRKYRSHQQPGPIDFNNDRLLSSSSPLPLRSLSILIPMKPPMDLGRSLDQFLALCDPTSFHLTGYGPLTTGVEAIVPNLDCFRLEWKRIKLFTLQRARWSLAISFHLSRSVKFSFDVKYDLSSFGVGSQLWRGALEGIVLDATRTNLLPETLGGEAGFIVHGMEGIQVQVSTEGGKTEVLDQLKEECERKFGSVAWEKMQRNIKVVVVVR